MPESYDVRMIRCDVCDKWFHFKCVGLRRCPKRWVVTIVVMLPCNLFTFTVLPFAMLFYSSYCTLYYGIVLLHNAFIPVNNSVLGFQIILGNFAWGAIFTRCERGAIFPRGVPIFLVNFTWGCRISGDAKFTMTPALQSLVTCESCICIML